MENLNNPRYILSLLQGGAPAVASNFQQFWPPPGAPPHAGVVPEGFPSQIQPFPSGPGGRLDRPGGRDRHLTDAGFSAARLIGQEDSGIGKRDNSFL